MNYTYSYPHLHPSRCGCILRRCPDEHWFVHVWVLANVVSGLVVFSMMFATTTGVMIAPFSILLTVLVLSTTPGIITGFAMIWLLNFDWKHNYPEFYTN